MPLQAGEDTWTALGFSELLTETWEEETFLFNPASGETHLLNQVALSLLEQLARKPASTREVHDLFLPDDAEPELVAALDQQLQQLELIGLTCRIPANH